MSAIVAGTYVVAYELPLVNTPGLVALVDEEDFERLSAYRWLLHPVSRIVRRWEYCTPTDERTQGILWVSLHRQILDAPPGLEVDHINGDRLDNRRCNLRLATRGQNQANIAKPRRRRPCSSRYKGVAKHTLASTWMAQIWSGGRCYYLGSFRSEEAAARAYDAAARVHHGVFARLNFPHEKDG